MAHVALLGAGDGIENLGPVQAEHLLTSRARRRVLDGLVLLPICMICAVTRRCSGSFVASSSEAAMRQVSQVMGKRKGAAG